LEVSNQ